ncbi:hypothetical protein HC931_12810 [Candidatus Gracilibacteria bacterium]|jgi:hypothetical protein|nr:hypothetical protein [Candidatus Gracilibacteria bacterium]NJM88179.1 hypothetical protein [Hydrococcus sp. RU_2_2]NJP19612.1 hypothetical protein [Hydrococcus sp. CRU_1_1]
MLKIDLLLRNSNFTLSVLRKSEEEANALFEKLMAAMNAEKIQLLKLTCVRLCRMPEAYRHTKTKIAILSNEIIAINLTEN